MLRRPGDDRMHWAVAPSSRPQTGPRLSVGIRPEGRHPFLCQTDRLTRENVEERQTDVIQLLFYVVSCRTYNFRSVSVHIPLNDVRLRQDYSITSLTDHNLLMNISNIYGVNYPFNHMCLRCYSSLIEIGWDGFSV